MKARIKTTGEIVEVEDLYDDGTALVKDRYFKVSELDFFEDFETIDWEQRRYELAKSALRDDTNENQWFVADSPLSVSYDDAVGNDHYFTEPKDSMFFWDINWMHATIISGNYHKATVEELIEHFKEKEE